MIYFPMPGPDQRLRLWKQSLPAKVGLEDGVRLEDIADRYEMTGGAIINVTRYCALMAMKRGGNTILQKDLLRGIRKEFEKEGKSA
jgi:ATP-dependent 26S proteasome regulatory subunit